MRRTHKPFKAVLYVLCAVTALISIIFDVFKSIFEERSHRSFLFCLLVIFFSFIHSFHLLLFRVAEWLTRLKINSVVHFCVKIREFVRAIWDSHKWYSVEHIYSWNNAFKMFDSPSDCLWKVIISFFFSYLHSIFGMVIDSSGGY